MTDDQREASYFGVQRYSALIYATTGAVVGSTLTTLVFNLWPRHAYAFGMIFQTVFAFVGGFLVHRSRRLLRRWREQLQATRDDALTEYGRTLRKLCPDQPLEAARMIRDMAERFPPIR